MKQKYAFESDSYIVHDSNIVDEVLQMYKSNGFKTEVVLRTPFKYSGPTLVRRISFPSNRYQQSKEISYDYRSYRMHIEVTYMRENGKLVSIPHIEPDPCVSPITHFLDGYLKGKVISGKPATDVLKKLLGIRSGDRKLV